LKKVNTRYFGEYKILYERVLKENKKDLNIETLVRFRFIPLEIFRTELREVFNEFLGTNIEDINSPDNYLWVSRTDLETVEKILKLIFGKRMFILSHSISKAYKELPVYRSLSNDYPSIEESGGFRCKICNKIILNKFDEYKIYEIPKVENKKTLLYKVADFETVDVNIKIEREINSNTHYGVYFTNDDCVPVKGEFFKTLSINSSNVLEELKSKLDSRFKYIGFFTSERSFDGQVTFIDKVQRSRLQSAINRVKKAREYLVDKKRKLDRQKEIKIAIAKRKLQDSIERMKRKREYSSRGMMNRGRNHGMMNRERNHGMMNRGMMNRGRNHGHDKQDEHYIECKKETHNNIMRGHNNNPCTELYRELAEIEKWLKTETLKYTKKRDEKIDKIVNSLVNKKTKRIRRKYNGFDNYHIDMNDLKLGVFTSGEKRILKTEENADVYEYKDGKFVSKIVGNDGEFDVNEIKIIDIKHNMKITAIYVTPIKSSKFFFPYVLDGKCNNLDITGCPLKSYKNINVNSWPFQPPKKG